MYKLLDVVAPYKRHYKNLFPICAKYGIDSLSVEQKTASTKDNMNKRLIDSFSVAFVRDQEAKRMVSLVMVKNDAKNARLLKWTLENYGYPSFRKIATTGNNDVFMPMLIFWSYMWIGVPEYYSYFKNTSLKYVKSGECSPREYATMIDHEHENNYGILYGEYFGDFLDTLKSNRNRRSIGLKSRDFKIKKISK